MIANLTDARAAASREAQLELVARGPDRVLAAVRAPSRPSGTLPLPHLTLPPHHDVRAGDVVLRRLHGTLAAAAERAPGDFPELLLTPGVGARTVFALAMAAEVIHGAPFRFADPARFAFALGGKDGHPFPVPVDVYDETIRVLRRAVDAARLSSADRLVAVRRLDAEARLLEQAATGPSFATVVTNEAANARALGGRTVFD